MKPGLVRLPSTRLLERLIETPDLVRAIQGLAPPHFSALIRRIGVEDAGELVALATTEQLIQAFDEDLFASDAPGERERFDATRFAIWLEVLLEAGDTAAAQRLSELSEDFVLHALLAAIVVLDDDALRARMDVADDAAELADKVLESALSEQLDGYLLVGRGEPGWDAWLSVILALDRDHRPFLERILDRAAVACAEYVDDLDELCEALTAAESLAEDVEAEREQRRAVLGYVEPRAGSAFLKLAARPLDGALEDVPRDANTRAYFRELSSGTSSAAPAKTAALLPQGNETSEAPLEELLEQLGMVEATATTADPTLDLQGLLQRALTELSRSQPERAARCLDELAYLANVLVAAARSDLGPLAPADAATAALTSVLLGALLVSEVGTPAELSGAALAGMLEKFPADILFRRAGAALVEHGLAPAERPFLPRLEELPGALLKLRGAESVG